MKKKLLNEKRVMFAFPHLALSIIFVVVPIIILFGYAMLDPKTGELSLVNLKPLFEIDTLKIIANSFLMALMTTIVCLVICYPLALALNRIKTNKTIIFVMLFILPMWVNSLLRLVAIKLLLEAQIGKGTLLVLIGMVYDFMPFMLLPLYTVIANTDNSYIEASQDLGASTLKTLLRVRLPLSIPGIVSGILMVFMPTISTFAVSERLGLPENILFGQLINQRFDDGNYGVGSVYSIVLMILIALSVLLATKISKKGVTTEGMVT